MKVLDRFPCIYYPVQFCKNKGNYVLALLNSKNEINAMTPAYVAHLGLKVRVTNIGVHKIDGSLPATYSMVITAFQVVNELGRSRFFQKTFLLANINMKVVLGMPVLTFSNADVEFAEKKLTWRTYTIKEALLTTRQVEIINQEEFAKAVLNENIEAFMVHISSLGLKMTIHSARKAQLALLLAEEVTMPIEYSDFADVFSEKSADVLLEQNGVNEHVIELEEGKQPPYEPIYIPGPFELKTVKTYIETNLVNSFIRALKSPAGALILFVSKLDSSLCLCVNYQGFNNLTIKNWYLLLLIGKSLN